MQKIQNILGKNPDVQAVYDEALAEIMAYPAITTFIQNQQLSQERVMEDIQAFMEYAQYLQTPTVEKKTEGTLFLNDFGHVEFGYRYAKAYQKQLVLAEYIECLFSEGGVFDADIMDFKAYPDGTAKAAAVQLVAQLRKNILPQKGLFLAGNNGVGKTHLLMAIAKEFYKLQRKVVIVFVPECLRVLKQNPYQAEQMIRKLQRADILMLDDIGSEMQTSFSRDEVLLPILNSRMNQRKLTYYSSNFNLEALEHHFSQTQYGEHEPVKAKRMMERIKATSQYVELIGKNQRGE